VRPNRPPSSASTTNRGPRNNANAALIFEFLYRFISISKSYFGKLDEESVKNNFVLIYELIDGPSFPSAYNSLILIFVLLQQK
jgi:hypothetical protein